MRRFWLLVLMLFVIAGCSPQAANPGVTVMPSPAPLQGTVDIVTPVSGSVIYAEMLYISGTAADVPAAGFRIVLLAPDDTVIAESVVQPSAEMWTVEIVHGYAGDPTEVTVVATGVDAVAGQDYDVETVVLSALENRPEGVFSVITLPADGSTVGGDQIQAFGTGSGLFENTLIVQLRQADGTVIDQKILTLNNPYFVDEVIWSTELAPGDYTGPAEVLSLYYSAQDGSEVILDRVAIIVSGTAG